jgi:hypothetical protein
MRVSVYFPLIHQTTLVVMKELNRILNRQNVLTAVAVDLVDHGRQRC